MSPRIAGADVSTTSFGWAAADGTLYTLKAHAGPDDVARRLSELGRSLERMLRLFPPAPELVVIEGYSLGSPGRLSLVRLGEIGGVVRLRLFELGIHYVEIAPKALKRYATGNGNAKKPAMIEAARALGAYPANDDQADAFLLRHLGRAAYGLEPIDTDHAGEVVAATSWPRLNGGAT